MWLGTISVKNIRMPYLNAAKYSGSPKLETGTIETVITNMYMYIHVDVELSLLILFEVKILWQVLGFN